MKHHNLTVINICLHRGRRHKSIMISKFSGYFIDYFTLTNSHFIRVQQTGFLPPYIKGHWQLNAGTHTSDPFITKNGDGTETGIGHPWETILCLTKDSQVLLLALLSLEQFCHQLLVLSFRERTKIYTLVSSTVAEPLPLYMSCCNTFWAGKKYHGCVAVLRTLWYVTQLQEMHHSIFKVLSA